MRNLDAMKKDCETDIDGPGLVLKSGIEAGKTFKLLLKSLGMTSFAALKMSKMMERTCHLPSCIAVHELYRTRGVSELRYRRTIRYLAEGSYGRVFLVKNIINPRRATQECIKIVAVDPPSQPTFAVSKRVKRGDVSKCLEEVRNTFLHPR